MADGRRRVEVPIRGDERALHMDVAFTGSLAEAYGTQLTDLENQSDLHDLLTVQGMYLLWNLQPGLSGERLRIALRHMANPHKHEAAFWEAPETGQTATSTTATVLIPYAPQYGYLQEKEMVLGRPLRMTFGLRRDVSAPEGSGRHVRVARANIWVTRDPVSPFPMSYRVAKDINTYRELSAETDAERYLVGSLRSRARVNFVLNRLMQSN